jgi:hypothetical protein
LVFAITEMRSHRRIRDASRIALVRPVQVNEFDWLHAGRETPNGVVSTDVPGGATDGIVVCGGLIGIAGRRRAVRRHDHATCRIYPLRNDVRHAAARTVNQLAADVRRPTLRRVEGGVAADAGDPLNLGNDCSKPALAPIQRLTPSSDAIAREADQV